MIASLIQAFAQAVGQYVGPYVGEAISQDVGEDVAPAKSPTRVPAIEGWAVVIILRVFRYCVEVALDSGGAALEMLSIEAASFKPNTGNSECRVNGGNHIGFSLRFSGLNKDIGKDTVKDFGKNIRQDSGVVPIADDGAVYRVRRRKMSEA